jgi:hypothetical protein
MAAATERRRHVRLKPSAEIPARVSLVGDGLMREMLDVVDISVGGMALTAAVLNDTKPGKRMKLQIALGSDEEHAIDVVTRWTNAGIVGVEVVDAEPRAAQAISRYVAELLERGGSA